MQAALWPAFAVINHSSAGSSSPQVWGDSLRSVKGCKVEGPDGSASARPWCPTGTKAAPECVILLPAHIQHHSCWDTTDSTALDGCSSDRCFTVCNTSICSSFRAKFPTTSCSHNKTFQHYYRFLPWLFGRRWISHSGHYEAHYIHYV